MRSEPCAIHVRHVWQGTLISALLNTFGCSLDGMLGSSIAGMPLWPSVASGGVGLGIAVFIRFAEPCRLAGSCRPWGSRGTGLGSVLFVLNNAAIVTALWITSGIYAVSEADWVPFQANKLGALAVPLLAPERWAGLASIAAFVGTAVLRFYLFDPAIRQHIAFGEPWAVLIYGAFGVALLFYRLRGLARERDLVRAQVESAGARKLARLLLAVRDLSNTPLQVIAISSAMLRTGHPDPRGSLDRLDRAIDELHALNGVLKSYESHLEWRPGDEAFDPTAVLRDQAETHPDRPE
jgi:hypothetical protein